MPRYMYFLLATAALVVGYIVYGTFVEKVFGAQADRPTPAKTKADGVDYVEMHPAKLWLIQLLNIAGVGPVFGPIMGALYGPAALLWIVIGSIFAGAVHDYLAGMLSVRYGGANVPDIVGYNLGNIAKQIMRVFAVILLLLVGVTFATAPAGLLTNLTSQSTRLSIAGFFGTFSSSINQTVETATDIQQGKIIVVTEDAAATTDEAAINASEEASAATDAAVTAGQKTISEKEAANVNKSLGGIVSTWFWLPLIFLYYFLATIVPIDKLIGRVYPLFGALLLIMAVGVTIMLFIDRSGSFYEWARWTNQHPDKEPLWPLMFITIACGALSGFHATQSPLMARCMGNEKLGRSVFYGAMIAEGFIGLVWATVGMTFYPDPAALADSITAGTASKVVYDSSLALLGPIGGVLAILGVVVLPVTSGDTAFRAARLTIADTMGMQQRAIPQRLTLAVPLFAIGILLSQVGFATIWQYFGWSNQTLAAIALWAGAAYLYRRDRLHWIATVPATFITAASVTFICYNKIGFSLSINTSYVIGVAVAVACLVAFLQLGRKEVQNVPDNFAVTKV